MVTLYPIIYTPSFCIFWGLSLGAGLFVGGGLTLALVAMMILVLISHEHAHVTECLRRGVKVNSVCFSWLGGAVDCDIKHAHDAVPILAAGLIDTGCYTVSFLGVLIALNVTRPIGLNFAGNPYLALLNGIVMFLVVMSLTNILPINYHHKKHGLISTDGWAALRFIELRDELMNDGRVEAEGISTSTTTY